MSSKVSLLQQNAKHPHRMTDKQDFNARLTSIVIHFISTHFITDSTRLQRETNQYRHPLHFYTLPNRFHKTSTRDLPVSSSTSFLHTSWQDFNARLTSIVIHFISTHFMTDSRGDMQWCRMCSPDELWVPMWPSRWRKEYPTWRCDCVTDTTLLQEYAGTSVLNTLW